jgi:predicted nucleic acid-binding protein
MKLADFPSGARLFVDANILVSHFSGISVECRAFLQRCESKQVDAFTGVHVVLEVARGPEGLLSNDSVMVAWRRIMGRTDVATFDADPDHVSSLRVY